MCGCEHHRDHNAPCTCTCPDHKAVRAEMSRTAPMSAADHTLTDAERAMFERIEDTGDTQGLTWRVQELVTEARALADEESASRVALANQLATAEAEKEALRADRDEIADRLSVVLCDLTGGKLSKTGYSAQTMIQAVEEEFEERAEAAEAALAGLVAAVVALAEASLQDGRGGAWVHDVWFRALIDADHAAALRAREAKALREAADDLLQVGLPSPSRREVHVWLRDRADSIEQAHP